MSWRTHYLLLSILALVFSVPVLYVFIQPFKTNSEIVSNPWAFPSHPTLQPLLTAWRAGNLPRYFVNSLFTTSMTIVVCLFLASLAAYAFSLMSFKGRRPLFGLTITGLMIPHAVIIIPLFILMRRLGLLDSLWSLVISYVASNVSFAIFLLANFFKNLPQEIFDAAKVDGCNSFDVYWRVVLPMSTPILAALVILLYLRAWNEFFLALTFITDDAQKTLPVGLIAFRDRYSVNWNVLMSGVMIATLPSLAVYAIFQRHFVRGIATGALH